MWIEIIAPAPVLNTPDFRFAFGGISGAEIPLDSKNFPFCFEFVALKKHRFQVTEILESGYAPIYRIFLPGYTHNRLYLDSRFTKEVCQGGNLPAKTSKKKILERMKKRIGTPYVWGGNWAPGIPQLLEYYPPKYPIDETTKTLWIMQGLDCSGLLYEASEGAYPRNTSELICFGRIITSREKLEPLDMIVYVGHVLFIVDPNTTIESKYPFGVIYRKLSERIDEIEQTRIRIENESETISLESSYFIRRL